MKNKYIIFSLVISLFIQCKTNKLAQIQKGIIKSYPAKFLNKRDFDKSRTLMFENLSPEILSNDTIILLEYFSDIHRTYYYTIYESNDKSIKSYIAATSIKSGKFYVDSLRASNIDDKILKMILTNKLNEIKKRGDATTLTPAAILIINIGVKDKEKNKFNFKTLVTQDFNL